MRETEGQRRRKKDRKEESRKESERLQTEDPIIHRQAAGTDRALQKRASSLMTGFCPKASSLSRPIENAYKS